MVSAVGRARGCAVTGVVVGCLKREIEQWLVNGVYGPNNRL